ncbi:hypothetical protein [Xanthobacter sp. KR7-225]|uniref:hypothetical protein n=1 Tax=Xanthobacter sp. KR7-225 TaxID=3156613 RepID=UPI0032B58424
MPRPALPRFALSRCAGILVALAAPISAAAARAPADLDACAHLENEVSVAGAALIATSPSTFDRFVADSRYCDMRSGLTPAWVRARDNPQCFVGYTCRTQDP